MSLVYLQISSYTIYRQVNQPIYYNSCLIYHSCWSPESSIKTLCTQKGAKNTFIDILIAYNVHNAYHHNSKSPHKCHIVTIDGLWINRDHVSLRHSCTSIAYCVNKAHHSHQPGFYMVNVPIFMSWLVLGHIPCRGLPKDFNKDIKKEYPRQKCPHNVHGFSVHLNHGAIFFDNLLNKLRCTTA